VDGKEYTSSGTILNNPLFDVKEDQFDTYDRVMTEMESSLTEMHNKVNQLYDIQEQLRKLMKDVKDDTLKSSGSEIIQSLETWDNEMIQRKSKAYDDVENFPNKFTAEYLFLINATESSIPRINQSSLDRRKELDAQWEVLNKQADEWLGKTIPDFNKRLWEAGIGAIQIR
jgi:hypothetical protein